MKIKHHSQEKLHFRLYFISYQQFYVDNVVKLTYIIIHKCLFIIINIFYTL